MKVRESRVEMETHVRDDSERRCESADPLTPRSLEEEEEHGHEEDVACYGRVAREASRVIPQ